MCKLLFKCEVTAEITGKQYLRCVKKENEKASQPSTKKMEIQPLRYVFLS